MNGADLRRVPRPEIAFDFCAQRLFAVQSAGVDAIGLRRLTRQDNALEGEKNW